VYIRGHRIGWISRNRAVVRPCRVARLKLNPEKWQFFQKQDWYHGHIVPPEGITSDPEKLKALEEWPTPKMKHKRRSFLGLCTYYRRFISGLANIAKPLTKFTEEKQAFQWTPQVEAAFQTIKRSLHSPLFLTTRSQVTDSSLTQTRVTSGIEECLPRYRTDRNE
jgi:hypothetical protein